MNYIELKRTGDNLEKILNGKNCLYERKFISFVSDEKIEKSEQYTFRAKFKDGFPSSFHLSANGVGSSYSVGYTSCGTGIVRTAAFVVSLNDEQQKGGLFDVKLFGMYDVISLEVTAGKDEETIALAKSERVKPNEVKPVVDIEGKPIQLIINLGADASAREQLPEALERMRENCPFYRALGFNGFESYVKWNFIEYNEGVFDWSYYDSVIDLAYEYGMKWFPLIIGGSAYALPEWYREKEGFTGFKCLEHGEENNVPTIFNEHQTPYITKYLHELGKHYEDSEKVFGIRLGPSGNYGESQYPATGNWGYKGQKEHMHIGWWAGDKDASPKFAGAMKQKYGDIAVLNEKWETNYGDFSEIQTFVPNTVDNLRRRKDFVDWYVDEMTDWCNRWGVWVREELKSHDIYQSAGGWGFCELGTDFTDQTRGMIPINGGIRATNEDESYELNFAITRMLSSAARFYKVPFGSEPAGYGTVRSVVNRLFNIVVNDGAHLFYYAGGFTNCDEGPERWANSLKMLNERSKPIIDVAVLYPDTLTKLTDSSLRWLDGSSFFSQVFPLRRKLDYDFCSERMVIDGALGQYKALVFLSRNHDGDYVEAQVLDKIDEWVRGGGTVIYPILHSNARIGPATVEGDSSVFGRWSRGDTGKGKVILIHTLREPLDDYIDEIADTLKCFENLNPLTLSMLNAEKPRGVYLSALESGKIAAYNDKEYPVVITLDGREITLEPISVTVI